MTVYMARAILEYPSTLGARFYSVELWNLHQKIEEVLSPQKLALRPEEEELLPYEEAHIENYLRRVKELLRVDILKDLAYLNNSPTKESPDE